MVSTTRLGYTTKFRLGAKLLQLERRVVFEVCDGGRIHRQVIEELCTLAEDNQTGTAKDRT